MFCFSGVYPLFKPGVSSLGGACVKAHITLKPNTAAFQEVSTKRIQINKNIANLWPTSNVI